MPNNRADKRSKKIGKAWLMLLIPIVILAIFLNFYPHMNYLFPLHVDEWYHIYIAEYIAQTGQLPQTGIYLRTFAASDLERGFHSSLALLYLVFRPTIAQWQYLPTIIFVLAVLSVFFFVDRLFGRREALIAAFLVSLLPTNVTIGGPVFLIPVNLSLIFIPLSLLFAFGLTKLNTIYNYIVLFLILTLMLYSHPPSAVVILLIITTYLTLNLASKNKAQAKHSINLLIVEIISAIAAIPVYLPYIEAKSGIAGALSFNFFIYLNQIPYIYGFVPTILFLLGFYVLSSKKDYRVWSMLLASVFLLLTIVLFANFNVNFLVPYQRVYVPLFLIMSIIASAAYAKILDSKQLKKFGIAIFAVLIIATLYFSIQRDITTPYYHIINNQQYQNFLWIKNNLNNSAEVIIDPWLAKAFGPVTGMKVYSVIPFGPNPQYNEIINNTYAFFAANCTDTQFLLENNISVAYSSKCNSQNLTMVNTNTYVLKR